MVAWQSNPTMGTLIADLGPYIGSDWPPQHPSLEHRFPIDAGEIDYYVVDPAVDNYLTMGFHPSGSDWSDSYIYEAGTPGDDNLGSGQYTDGSSSGPPSGAHIYVAWYDTSYSTVPAAPSVTPESLIPASYSALGILTPLVYHWGPWITPAPRTFTFGPGSGRRGIYGYNPNATDIASAIASGGVEDPGLAGRGGWIRDTSDSTPFRYAVVTLDASLGLTQYEQENHPGVFDGNGFFNAHPTIPTDALEIEHEATWDHTDYAAMLASVVGDISITTGIDQFIPSGGSGMAQRDVTIIGWVEDSANLENNNTTFGYLDRISGVPTQSELNSADAARFGTVSMPVGTSSVSLTVSAPLSDFYSGMLPYRDDLSPSLRLCFAAREGIQNVSPTTDGTYSTTGRFFEVDDFTVTVTYVAPRYRFKYVGPADFIPPLRQLQRDDVERQLPRNGPTSIQASARQGPRGTYL